jgi:predicted deacetylase
MIPKPAQYLLRFDDFCPAMDWTNWQRFAPLIEEFGLKPILAVIPDNEDGVLNCRPPEAEFWKRMRALEQAGATIALHGFRHICVSQGRSLVPLHPWSEFAGMTEERQRRWIHEGLEILRGEGLNPTMFIAPRHGFDEATLRALKAEGISLLSDGFARIPFKRGGVTWIPQQLWGPVEKERGVWAICIHSNTASEIEVVRLRDFLLRFSTQFTSVEQLVGDFSPDELGLWERIYEALALSRVRASLMRKRWRTAS